MSESTTAHGVGVVKRQTPVTLESVYDVPDPCDCVEAFARYCHDDLSRLTRAELLYELERVRLRLLLGGPKAPHPWLLDRLDRLQRRVAQLDRAGQRDAPSRRRSAG